MSNKNRIEHRFTYTKISDKLVCGYTYFYNLHENWGITRTSDSLNEGLPIKMTREKFQRK